MDKRVKLMRGDITKLDVDAIVNAANSALTGGAGVNGAIHRAGGPEIMKECERIGKCETGEAVITSGGALPAKHVIHAVGPVWQGGNSNEDISLASAYQNSLKRAVENNLQALLFQTLALVFTAFLNLRPQELH